MTISLAIAEDHRLVADALATMLGFRDDIRVVGVAPSGAEMFDLDEQVEPDVILMDVSLQGLNGIPTVTRTFLDRVGPLANQAPAAERLTTVSARCSSAWRAGAPPAGSPTSWAPRAPATGPEDVRHTYCDRRPNCQNERCGLRVGRAGSGG